MKLTISDKTNILLGLFIATLVTGNLIGNKITDIVGISVSVGIFAYPITFLVTDIIEEVHGKEKTKSFIYAGFFSLLLVTGLVLLSLWLPPAGRFPYNEQFTVIFSSSARIVFASLVAFIISQTHDIWAFNFWKRKTKGRYLWFRNNASTWVSQFIDTVIFIFLAFYMVTPKYDVLFMFELIIPYWILKILFAAGDTPFAYLGVRWLRGPKSEGPHPQQK
jgi:uncharacterized integral membrane protein (TIGR00697 family)